MLARPGDTILLESPTYYNILQMIESLGLHALEVPTHPRDGVVLEELEIVLERAPTHGRIAACAFIPSFANPLGACMPEENKRRLVEMLAARQIPLIEDDIWGDTTWSNRCPKTCKSFDREGLVLLCSSFSKTLA